MKVYPPRDIRPFVMYCVNGKPRSSLLIESTDSMIIESNSVSQQGDAPGYFKIVLFFYLSVIRLHYEHKLARERRKYMAKKRAEKRRKLFFKKETAVP